MSSLTRIHVALYEDEGLEPDMLTDVMHDVSTHGADPYFERPQDEPFRQGAEVANSACECGSVCHAGAGMGRFVPDLYGVAGNAFFVRPDSEITRLSDLAGVPVGVGIMAGSHFTALHALELVLPPEKIKIENVGGRAAGWKPCSRGRWRPPTFLTPRLRSLRRGVCGRSRAASSGPSSLGISGNPADRPGRRYACPGTGQASRPTGQSHRGCPR